MALQYVGGIAAGSPGSTGTDLVLSLTSLTGGISASAAEDDIVIVAVTTGSLADRDLTISTSGYTEIAELHQVTTIRLNFAVFSKIMGSTPDATVAVGPSGNNADAISAAVHVWRGVDLTTPFDVTPTTDKQQFTGQPTPPPITPTTSGAVIVACGGGSGNRGAATMTNSQLSNFVSEGANDSYDSSTGIGSFNWISGTFTPIQFDGGQDGTNGAWGGVTLALRPASGSVNTTNFFYMN